MNKATLKDNKTSETKTFDTEYSEFWWEEGNGSCDCNRGLEFGLDLPCSADNRF